MVAGRLAVPPCHWYQRMRALDDAANLVGGDDAGPGPRAGAFHVHVFDEAQRDAAAAEVLDERQHLCVIGAALDHAIDLDRRQARGACRLDPLQHAADREIDVVHGAEDLVVQAVQADRDPAEARVPQRAGLAGKQAAIGGHCHFHLAAVDGPHGGYALDQRLDALAQQRLAAGQAHLLHAKADKGPHDPEQFHIRQALLGGQERIVAPEARLGHAVGAAEVALIDHGQPQVPQRAAQLVPAGARCLGRYKCLKADGGGTWLHKRWLHGESPWSNGVGHGAAAGRPVWRLAALPCRQY